MQLNPQAARSAFLNTAQPPVAAAPAPPAATPARATIRVNANQQWTDTGIMVRRGETVQFNVTGEITIAQGVIVNANGQTGTFRRVGFATPVSAAGAGALIGNVGGSLFAIGANTQPIAMPADGRLLLGANEGRFDDNSGFFSVVITQQTQGTGASDSRGPRGRGNGSGR